MAYAKTLLACLAAVLTLALPIHGDAAHKPPASRAQKTGGAARKKMNKLPNGVWGGRGLRLDVDSRGARVEFDCGRGTLNGPVVLDRDNRFDVRGTFTRQRGGPTRMPPDSADGQPPADDADTIAARYAGRVRGRTMSLTVTSLADGETIGTFSLGLGREPLLVKCL